MFAAVWQTIFGSFGEAFAIVRRGAKRYLPWIAGSSLFGIPTFLAPAHATPDQLSTPALVMMGGLFATMIVIACSILADVVRSIRRDFAMTPRRLASAALVYFATALATDIALAFVYVPGFYIGVKLSQWLPYHLLHDEEIGESARRSWNDTTGVYWETLTAITLGGLVYVAGLVAVSVVPGVAFDHHPLALVANPVALVIATYAIAYVLIAWFRWSSILRAREPERTPMPAAPLAISPE